MKPLNVGKSLIVAVLVLLSTTGFGWAKLTDGLASVVIVLPIWDNGGKNLKEPEGSGIVIGKGRMVLTAAHVLRNTTSVRIKTANGKIMTAKLLWSDAETDVALLSIPSPLPAATLANSPDVGEKVCAVGNSFGLGISMSCGVVSAKQLTRTGFNQLEDFIHSDAAVNPGKSGGALVDSKGHVVGMLSAIFTKESDANTGVNFSVSTRLLKALLRLKSQSSEAKWPQSMMRLRVFPARRQIGITGAEIISVRVGSPAANTGLKVGDVITHFGIRRIQKPTDFYTEFAIHNQKNVALIITRENKKMQMIWHFKSRGKTQNE